MWDPDQYRRYAGERARPFLDLMAQVPDRPFITIVDAGCGPGHLTLWLAQHWPGAQVLGFDHSTEMVAAANAQDRPANVEYRQEDVTTWNPDLVADLVVCNAVLQWVPDHLPLLGGWAARLPPGGVLAVQVPANLEAPHHLLLTALRQSSRWAAKLAAGADRSLAVPPMAGYLNALCRPGFRVNAWDAIYQHILPGEDAVLDWVLGTALRPVLNCLNGAETATFLTEYSAVLRDAYPRREFGTVFPFHRRFLVVEREGA